ncbi:OR67C protein, partial [Acromyrmex insinuator]
MFTKRMNFENVNLLNSRVNMLSGNLLPIASDNLRFSVIWRTYSAAIWLIQLTHTIALIFGIIMASKENGLKGSTHTILLTKFIFFYVNCNLPATFSSEPFSNNAMISSTVLKIVGTIYLFLKKFGMDVYMMHLVLMLTAQYRYTATKLAILFRDLQIYNESRKEHYPMENRRIERELRKLCLHQNIVLNMSFILKKLLSVNFSLLYINNVLRFCFIGIILSTKYFMYFQVPLMNIAEGISVTIFGIGTLTQFFVLCSSVQTLSDASTKITDKAFDEGWYQLGPSLKRIFILLIISNNLECKIAAIGKFNLSLPSFMTIINQSYSIALLFLKAR